MRARRVIATAAIPVAAAIGLAAPASAAVPASHAQVFTATCPGMEPVQALVVPGNGTFTPAFIEGTNQVLVPYSFSLTGVDQAGNVVFQNAATKPAPLPPGGTVLGPCDVTATFTDGGQTITVSGTVTVFVPGG